jgi:2-dehydropantoate 2-reductase
LSATVAVLGPGGVGGALAVRLSLAGCRVICVARSEPAAAISCAGLTLECEGGTLTSRPEAVESLAEPVDLLLVTVKTFGLDDALLRICADAEVVLPLLNGIEHMGALHRRFGESAAAGSIGRLEAYRRGPTEIVQATARPVVTAAADGLPADALEAAVGLLAVAGVDVTRGESEAAVLWQKAARLAPLAALTSTTQRPLGDLRSDQRLRVALDEACAVAAADGVDVSAADQWAMIEAMPATLTTSAARDVAAGRPSEIDAIVGGVVRAGRRRGVPTPTLTALLAELEGE